MGAFHWPFLKPWISRPCESKSSCSRCCESLVSSHTLLAPVQGVFFLRRRDESPAIQKSHVNILMLHDFFLLFEF